MAATRRAYTGAAVSTTTTSNIAASGTTSFTITAYTGWPYGTDPFYVVVEPGAASEEKILVTRTGSTDTTINIASDSERGQDGTSAVAHSSGATVFPVFTSVDADEANAVASVITADTTNSRIGIGTATPDTELHISANSGAKIRIESTDTSLAAAESIGAIEWEAQDVSTGSSGVVGKIDYLAQDVTPDYAMAFYTMKNDGGTPDFSERMRIDNAGNVGINDTSPSYTLDVDGDINATGDLRIGGTAIGSYSSYTPVLTASSTNPTLGTGGVATGSYCVIGDMVHYIAYIQFGSGMSAGIGDYFISLPVAASTSGASQYNLGSGYLADYSSPTSSNRYPLIVTRQTSLTCALFIAGGTLLDGVVTHTHPNGPRAASDSISLNLMYRKA